MAMSLRRDSINIKKGILSIKMAHNQPTLVYLLGMQPRCCWWCAACMVLRFGCVLGLRKLFPYPPTFSIVLFLLVHYSSYFHLLVCLGTFNFKLEKQKEMNGKFPWGKLLRKELRATSSFLHVILNKPDAGDRKQCRHCCKR